MKITPAIIANIHKGKAFSSITDLNLSGKNIEEIDDISSLIDLKKLNLSKNEISNLDGISFNRDITWLDVSNNKLETTIHIKKLIKLTGN